MAGGYPLQLAFQIKAVIGDGFKKIRLADLLQDSQSRGAHERVAIECAALVAVFKAGRRARSHQRRQRNAAADSLSRVMISGSIPAC